MSLPFDGDDAGAKYTKKWTEHLKEQGAEFSSILPRYETQRRSTPVSTPQPTATLLGYFRSTAAIGGHRQRMTRQPLFRSVTSHFTIEVNHFQISEKDQDKPEFKYSLKIKPQRGRAVNALATGTDLKSPDKLRGFFLNHAKASWEGGTAAAYALVRRILRSEAPQVRQAEQIGHDPKTGWHILKHVAISPKGQVIQPEKGGFFKLSGKDCIRPFWTETLKPEPVSKEFIKEEVVPAIKGAWCDKGLAALSFLTASLFVNKIKLRNRC